MMTMRLIGPILVAAVAFGCCATCFADAVEIVKHVQVTHDGVAVRASIVPAGAKLAHTAQVFGSGEDAARQTDKALDDLAAILGKVGASLDTTARVNLYATSSEAAKAAREALATRVKCAVSTVVTDLPQDGALVALDAVAVATAETSPDPSAVRILDSGRAVYVSGMAAEGDMREATRLTLEKLDGTLKHLGLTRKDVVHVKSFLREAKDVKASRAELDRFFDGNAPPAVWVQWTMKDPIEIEMIAQGPPPAANVTDTVKYINPPDSKVSPLYSRVATVHGGQVIYTSGIDVEPGAAAPTDAAAETRRALSALRALVDKSGGDFDHLVKATYYPATDATSAALNQVRPDFYNPQRPPAASKAPARGTGVEGCSLTLDLIAVTPAKAR